MSDPARALLAVGALALSSCAGPLISDGRVIEIYRRTEHERAALIAMLAAEPETC